MIYIVLILKQQKNVFVQAGLVDDILSQHLIIALEPEAASLYCRTLGADKFLDMSATDGEMAMKPGDKYMIVDCGGKKFILFCSILS